MKTIIPFLFSFFFAVVSFAQEARPLYVFDFEMNDIPIPKRTSMLVDLGYAGVTFAMKSTEQIRKYNEYMDTPEAKSGRFSIPIVYFPYHFENDPIDEGRLWQKVLATPSLSTLWVIFVDRNKPASIEQGMRVLGQMADYAEKLGKDIVIYPHDNTLIESVEEAIPYIQQLARSNLYLSMHSCHEMRAGNGDRMLEVAIKAAPYLKFVSIAGSDRTMYSEGLGAWEDAIKPLDLGDYDMTNFLSALTKVGYDKEIFLHTFGVKEKPWEHLSRSMEKWAFMMKQVETDVNGDISTVLDAPENAYYDPISESWFVTSLGGGKVTLEEDDYGWITKLDRDLEIISSRWVSGLDAPTGMTSFQNSLYVVDRGVLVRVEISTGDIIDKIKLPNSEFVNDAAVTSDGDVFVSDTYANRIYKVSMEGEVEVFVESEELECPNGLWVDGNELIVATWGPMTNLATFETSRKGTIKKINLRTRKITQIGLGPIANFDGIIKYKKSYYATDWTGGRLLKMSKSGKVTEVLTGFNQFADLGLDRQQGLIVVPEMSKNRIIKFSLK